MTLLRCSDCGHLAFWHAPADQTHRFASWLPKRRAKAGCAHAGCSCTRTVVP